MVHIRLIICTYKRNKELYTNLDRLRDSRFLNPSDELYGGMSICIIDNASELMPIDTEYVKLYHNLNSGGSGGFARGMLEARKDEGKYGITHVVLMDDDVEVIPETFYRLYALLSLLKKEYQKEAIAGRMFRMDKKQIQYTAAEIWNAGSIRHIGFEKDMTQIENLWSVNDNTGAEYSGWWLACFPMEFVRDNTPLPFFLHCDDVEYGLRHGGTPIILNGIQVWHETYEYRQSPVIAYYDTRNPLIVNAMYGLLPGKEQVLEEWKQKISEQHVKGEYLVERMMIWGMLDFGSGGNYFWKTDVSGNNDRLCRKIKCRKVGNSILWRWTEWKITHSYKKILGSFGREKSK